MTSITITFYSLRKVIEKRFRACGDIHCKCSLDTHQKVVHLQLKSFKLSWNFWLQLIFMVDLPVETTPVYSISRLVSIGLDLPYSSCYAEKNIICISTREDFKDSLEDFLLCVVIVNILVSPSELWFINVILCIRLIS